MLPVARTQRVLTLLFTSVFTQARTQYDFIGETRKDDSGNETVAPPLDRHHTHFLLVERQAIDFMSKLQQHIHKGEGAKESARVYYAIVSVLLSMCARFCVLCVKPACAWAYGACSCVCV